MQTGILGIFPDNQCPVRLKKCMAISLMRGCIYPPTMTDTESNHADLIKQIKEVMIDELMLQNGIDEITDDALLFDPAGLGLDSVDALQLVVGLEKKFGLKISDAEDAKGILKNITTIAEAIRAAG